MNLFCCLVAGSIEVKKLSISVEVELSSGSLRWSGDGQQTISSLLTNPHLFSPGERVLFMFSTARGHSLTFVHIPGTPNDLQSDPSKN